MSYVFGPSGSTGGTGFFANIPAARGPWKISEVGIRSGDRVDQIQIVWVNQAGETLSSPNFGGNGGSPLQFNLAQSDYLTQITGSIGSVGGRELIFSLQLITQRGVKSPLYGKDTGAKFDYQCPPGYQIIGLFGRAGEGIDALGIYIDPIPRAT